MAWTEAQVPLLDPATDKFPDRFAPPSVAADKLAAAASAAAALASEQTATTQAGTATTQAGIATTQAGTATTQAGIATTQAETAATQAGIATTQAETAATQAGIATTQAETATTQAGLAQTAASNASISAGAANTSADTAATQAGVATTQAGTATTKAGEASTSADTATTKAGEAAASAAAALVSEQNAAATLARYRSGTGSPEGVITAPVGTEWIDTEGTNGAWKWMKKSGTGATGWVVMDGDTGWRDISSLLANGWTGTVAIKRTNSIAYMRVGNLSAANATNAAILGGIPAGFTWNNAASLSPRPVFHMADTAATPRRFVGLVSQNALPWTPSVYGDVSWFTNAAWPTTLPGSPA